jgi:hypothetical protein
LMVINYLLDPAAHSAATAAVLATIADESNRDGGGTAPQAAPAALMAVAVDLAIGNEAAPAADPPAATSLATAAVVTPPAASGTTSPAVSDAALAPLDLNDADAAEDDELADALEAWAA